MAETAHGTEFCSNSQVLLSGLLAQFVQPAGALARVPRKPFGRQQSIKNFSSTMKQTPCKHHHCAFLHPPRRLALRLVLQISFVVAPSGAVQVNNSGLNSRLNTSLKPPSCPLLMKMKPHCQLLHADLSSMVLRQLLHSNHTTNKLPVLTSGTKDRPPRSRDLCPHSKEQPLSPPKEQIAWIGSF
jgi:hypothetical protein